MLYKEGRMAKMRRTARLRHWLFKILFPMDYMHLRHLIDDVIELELENKRLRNNQSLQVETGSDAVTQFTEINVG